MPTSNTFARSIARINIENRHTSKQGFVFDKASELVESPTVMCGSLFFPYSSPFSNILQIFKNNRRLRVFGFGNDSLADYVISMCSETSFFPFSLCKKAFSRTSAFLLKLLANIPIPATNRKKLVGCEVISRGQGGNVLNAPVNTDNVCKIFWFRVLNIASRVKVEYIIYQNKIGFSLLRFKKFFLSFATKIGDFKTTFACPDRNKLLFCFPRQDARIIRNSSKKLKLSLCFFVEFIGIGNFRNTTYYNLSRKIKLFFCGLISKFMQIILAEDFGLPRPFRNQVASLIGHYHCMLQGFKLFFVRVKFYFGCKFHGFKYRIYLFSCQVFNWFFSRKERFLLPMPEGRGIRNRGF